MALLLPLPPMCVFRFRAATTSGGDGRSVAGEANTLLGESSETSSLHQDNFASSRSFQVESLSRHCHSVCTKVRVACT